MKQILARVEDKADKVINALIREFSEVRTDRASPGLVENLHIDYYETPTQLRNIALITVPDVHMIVIQPWDVDALGEIEKSILKSNLGITPSNDGKVIRLVFPPISKDRRIELVKQLHPIAETKRISLRNIRRETKEFIEENIKIEDERFRGVEQLQKITDKYMEKIDEMLKVKEKEILG